MKLLFSLALLVGIFVNARSQTITITYDALGNRLTKSVIGTYPSATITGDSIICQGDTAHLLASGGTAYLWSTSGTTSNISFVADTTRTYSVTVYNNLGCATMVHRLLTVKHVPQTGPIIGDTVVHVGDAIVYSVPAHTGSFYDWGFSNGSFGFIDTGYPGPTISIQWTTPGVDTIEVYERLPNGCNSLKVRLRVTVLPANNSVSYIQPDCWMKVYPNPTDNNAQVRLKLARTEDVMLTIIDELGRKTGSISVKGKSDYLIPLDKSLFQVPGIYTIQALHGNAVNTQKLTVIH